MGEEYREGLQCDGKRDDSIVHRERGRRGEGGGGGGAG